MSNLSNIIGKRYGRLIVTGFSHIKKCERSSRSFWKCKCDCGNEVIKSINVLTRGDSKSCGCITKLPVGVASRNRVLNAYKRHARKINKEWNIEEEFFNTLTQRPCFYCGSLPANYHKGSQSTGGYTYNGIDRIDSDKGYTKDNVVSCCFPCNRAKGRLSQQEFRMLILRIYRVFIKRKHT